MAEETSPFIPFRFNVTLFQTEQVKQPICRGAFSEVSGLEATMAPKNYREGGRNWGDVQLSGPTAFATVILKRGVTEIGDLWNWFEATTRSCNYGLRYGGTIEVQRPSGEVALTWHLVRVLPVKFKGPDLSSTASQVAIEELHLVHEGLTLERPKR